MLYQYLVTVENNTLKTYTFSKILNIKDTNKNFKINKDFVNTINENKATWFSQTVIEVVLQIDTKVAEYFKRRDLKNTRNKKRMHHSINTSLI